MGEAVRTAGVAVRIAFALRADAVAKPGGDAKKVQHYTPFLEAAGHEVVTVFSTSQLSAARADVCHVINLDLPIENLKYARVARRLGVPVVVSTVSHPYSGLRGLYEKSADRHFRRLRGLGIPAEVGLLLRERVKLATRRDASFFTSSFRYRKAQQKLLDVSDAVLPMAEGEARELRDNFVLPELIRVVPNGLSFQMLDAHRARSTDVAVVGRVEPRKNTLELARALAKTTHQCTFIGARNDNHVDYFDSFKKLVDTCSNLSYTGPLASGEVRLRLANAKTYINGSWCEVVSQSDIEAASMGCRVVSTSHSYLADFLGERSATFDPSRLFDQNASSYVSEMLASAAVARAPRVTSWADASDQLLQVYVELRGLA